MARRRRVTPEELELWSRVAATARRAGPVLHAPSHLAPAGGAAAGAAKPALAPAAQPQVPANPARFRIGQAATAPAPTRFHPAPSPADRLAAQPSRMDSKLNRRMSRGKLAPDARLDLHGLTLNDAQPVLERFVLRAHAAGHRLVLVITGKGRQGGPEAPLPVRPGALRHHVPLWLARPPLSAVVLQTAVAHRRHGGDGAYYVYLRK